MTPNFLKLDYKDIKQNLISFLKTQDKFSGYNFEGSTLNVLLDILAYNTHYQAFYNNIAFNEAFLDTAQKRSSVVSIAKALGYTPVSTKSSVAVIEVFKGANPDGSIQGTLNPYVLPKYTQFKVNFNGLVYYFRNMDDALFFPSAFNAAGVTTEYSTGPINIKEGIFKQVSFIIDGSNPFQKIDIVSNTIDTGTIEVRVQESITNTNGILEVWSEANNITELSGNSNVYFLEEGPNGNYRIYFGDGVIGRRLQDGNLVNITFLESSGEESNNIGINDSENQRVFTTTAIDGFLRAEVVTPAFGGKIKETINSIKYNAPKSFSNQERAVTISDYVTILQKDYDFIKSIKCWGGEESNPPQYGKVFIAIKPENRVALTSTEKQSIVKSLTKSRSVVGIIPEIVDPNIIYLIINCDAKIDIIKTKGSINQLKTKIAAAISQYILEKLDIFDEDFIANELESTILNKDESIISVNIIPQLEYRLQPFYNLKQDYTINFQNKLIQTENIFKPSVKSSNFSVRDHLNQLRTCNLFDDGSGKMYIAFQYAGKTYSLGKTRNIDISIEPPEPVGTVDYSLGKIYLDDFKPLSSGNNIIKFFANISDADVFVDKDTILSIDTADPASVVINLVESAYRKPIK